MEEDHAAELLALNGFPATPLCRIHFVAGFPTPFNRRLTTSSCQSAVHVTVDLTKVKLTISVSVEVEVPFLFRINEIVIPSDHRRDSPTASEGFFVAAFFCMAKVTVTLFVGRRVSIAYPVIALFNFGMSLIVTIPSGASARPPRFVLSMASKRLPK